MGVDVIARLDVSIHTPLAGSDGHGLIGAFASPVSIHTPLAGSDRKRRRCGRCYRRFQSTLPLRGVTWQPAGHANGRHVSIHTPLAGSDLSDFRRKLPCEIVSIHTPLAGSDFRRYTEVD